MLRERTGLRNIRTRLFRRSKKRLFRIVRARGEEEETPPKNACDDFWRAFRDRGGVSRQDGGKGGGGNRPENSCRSSSGGRGGGFAQRRNAKRIIQLHNLYDFVFADKLLFVFVFFYFFQRSAPGSARSRGGGYVRNILSS